MTDKYDIEKVSPRPWFREDTQGGGCIEIQFHDPEQGDSIEGICTMTGLPDEENEANIAHIVHCTNNFDDLVAALEETTRALESAYKALGDDEVLTVCVDPWGVLKDSKATLNRAKGES